MKNLADLKRDAKLYTWELVFNSWFPNGNNLSGQKRHVSIVQSAKIALKTTKKDGTTRDSWLDFPKAKEMVFADCFVLESGERIEKGAAETLLIIEEHYAEQGTPKKHTMVYRLEKI